MLPVSNITCVLVHRTLWHITQALAAPPTREPYIKGGLQNEKKNEKIVKYLKLMILVPIILSTVVNCLPHWGGHLNAEAVTYSRINEPTASLDVYCALASDSFALAKFHQFKDSTIKARLFHFLINKCKNTIRQTKQLRRRQNYQNFHH